MVLNCSIRTEGKSFFVFKLILHTLVDVTNEKITLVVTSPILFEIWLACQVRNVAGRAMLGDSTVLIDQGFFSIQNWVRFPVPNFFPIG